MKFVINQTPDPSTILVLKRTKTAVSNVVKLVAASRMFLKVVLCNISGLNFHL